VRPGHLIRSRADLLVGLGFALAWLAEALVRDADRPAQLAQDVPGVVLLPLLALRRRRPLLTMVLLTGAFSASTLVGWALRVPSGDVVVPILAILVAVYSLGAHASRPAVLAGAPLALLPVLAADLTDPGDRTNSLASGLAFFTVFIVVLPVVAGRLVRGRTALVARLREQQRLLAEEREAATAAALTEERLQVAGRLEADLIAGTAALAAQADRVGDAAAHGRRELVEAIEDRARTLLARTRSVVVSLAEETPPAPPAAPALLPSVSRTRAPGNDSVGLTWSALAAAAVGVGLMLQVPGVSARVPVPVALAACLALAAPLALAWRRPVLATVAVQGAAAVVDAVVVPLPGLFAAIGLTFLPPFFGAAFATRRGAVAVLAVCCAGELIWAGAAGALSNLPLLVLSWAAGLVLAERGRLVGELREITELLARERESAVRYAVLEERARIAREVHDSVGHRLTVLALHASAARRMWETDGARAEAAVATIARVAGEALAELRRAHAGDAGTAGADLAAVTALVAGARAAGLPVRLAVDGSTAGVPAGTQATAYRVVQEALTNVLRHAPGAPVTAEVRCTGDRLTVEVRNAAPAADPPPPGAGTGSGSGLAGMRRRVTACGGRLEWGARPEGGFAVRAEFPLAVVPA
jgi:signal transduction histidine kinase